MSQPLKIRAARWAGLTVRTGRLLLGPAVAAAVSVAVGELAGHLFGRGLAPWVGLLIGGGFGLLIAREVNSVPRAVAPHHETSKRSTLPL